MPTISITKRTTTTKTRYAGSTRMGPRSIAAWGNRRYRVPGEKALSRTKNRKISNCSSIHGRTGDRLRMYQVIKNRRAPQPAEPMGPRSYPGSTVAHLRSATRVCPEITTPINTVQAHFPRLAGHPPETLMYDKMQQHYYWSHIENDVYKTVRECLWCARDAAETRYLRELQLFPRGRPLEFVALDGLRPLTKTMDGTQFVFIIIKRYWRVARAI